MSMLMTIFSNSSFCDKKVACSSMLKYGEYPKYRYTVYHTHNMSYVGQASDRNIHRATRLFQLLISICSSQGKFLHKKNKLSTTNFSQPFFTTTISRSSNHNFELNHDFELACLSMLMVISIPGFLSLCTPKVMLKE